MTRHQAALKREIGIRELHDQLSRYVRHAAEGGDVVVTMRGRPVVRMAAVSPADPLSDLRARGLVSDGVGEWQPRGEGLRPKPSAPVSDLVAEQRR